MSRLASAVATTAKAITSHQCTRALNAITG